jgi:endonuclease YncB( thermonuclease family)
MGKCWRHFVAILLLTSHAACLSYELVGRVVGVMDGDTIELLTERKELIRVRLAGIDAPEKRQAFGQVSKRALSDLAYARMAKVDWSKKDRYGRAIGKVIVAGGDVNFQMIARGLAWHYKQYQKEQSLDDRLSYAQAEETAHSGRLGLWADKTPVAPWEFRKSRRDDRTGVSAEDRL